MNRSSRSKRGGTLVEVIVALALLEGVMVGAAGWLVLAHRALARAELMHRVTQAAAGVADSLLAAGSASVGERVDAWGTLRWSVTAEAGEISAEDRAGVRLLAWWIGAAEEP